MEGIWRFIRLAIDPKSARDLEKDAQSALDKGTDPKKPTRNLSKVEQGMQNLRRAAIALGGAIAAAFTVRAIGRFLSSSLKAADELRRSRLMLTQAVENEGTAWANVAYQVDQVTKALWETHRLTEGEVNPILRTLIQVTGDYENSLRAVGLAADLAAALQMDQVTAARLLGRVLRGDTSALTRYGIEIREGADAVQILTERLGGMAKAAAPPTVQLTKAFNDLKEAIGEALIDAGAGESIIERLVVVVQSLTRYLNENGDTWRRWGVGLLSVVESTFKGITAAFEGIRNLIIRFRIQMLEARIAVNQFFASWSPIRRVREESAELVRELTRDLRQLQALLLNLSTPRAPGRPGRPGVDLDLGLPEVRRAGDGEAGPERFIPGMRDLAVMQTDIRALQQAGREAFGAIIFADLMAAMGPANQLIEEQTDRIKAAQDAIARNAAIAAHNMTDAFAGFFEGMAQGFMGMMTMGEALREGVTGIGGAIVEELSRGKAEYHMAEGAGALASGTWPPNPIAIRAATQHFIAAGLFRALPGVVRSMGRGGGGSRPSIPSPTRSMLPTAQFQAQAPEINIYIDPLNPSNPAWQSNLAQTLRGVTQRYGSTNVNVRPRTA